LREGRSRIASSRGPAPFLSFAAGKASNLLGPIPRLFTDFDLLLPNHSTISRYILRLTDSIQLFCMSIAFSRASSSGVITIRTIEFY